MNNLLTYVQQFGQESFQEKSVGEVDILLLTELGYLTYDAIVPSSFEREEGLTFSEIWHQLMQKKEDLTLKNPWMMTEERIDLLQLVSESIRYRDVTLFGYINDVDTSLTKQFAAMVFQWDENQRLIVFRGTDETLIGWKEDFMMTYAHEIPAQVDAVHYMSQQAEIFKGRLIVSGHSKGGNLALYASAMQMRSVQERIDRIYCWDAPGVHRTVLESEGYQNIVHKSIRYVPEDSIVGVMLESTVPFVVIKSAARGAAQHSAMTWVIEADHFVEVPELTRNSKLTDQTFKKWTAAVSDEDLALFWDCFFELLFDLGIDTVNDVYGNVMFYLQRFIERANHMNPEKREVLIRVALLLIQLRYTVWRESLNVSVEVPSITIPTMEEILKQLHLVSPNIAVAYEASDENETIRRYYQQRHQQKKMEQSADINQKI